MTTQPPSVENEQYATKEDVQQAMSFLADLPPACMNSSASVSSDGTVSIQVICKTPNKSINGLVEIKDGIVTKIR